MPERLRPAPSIPGINDLEPVGRGGFGTVYSGWCCARLTAPISWPTSARLAARTPRRHWVDPCWPPSRTPPPEVLDGQPATVASDVYSPGATLHAALRGRSPFESGPDDAPISLAVRVLTTRLSPACQERTGESSYRRFWQTIDRVEVLNAQWDGLSANATLRYTRTDGTTSTESVIVRFVTAAGTGALLIDDYLFR